MSEPRLIFLGAIEKTDPDESITFDIDVNADPDAIRAAIEKANLERALAARRETERLRDMFLPTATTKGAGA